MTVKTKDLVVAALLAALSMLIPLVFPSIPLGPFTATFASHLPIMIAMFISPAVSAAVAVGSLLGFAIKFASMPWVIARAAMHIPFALLGANMLKKRCNTYVTAGVTMVVHAVLEVIAVLPFLNMMPKTPKMLNIFSLQIPITWSLVILFGTMIHHAIDFTLAMAILPVLRRTGYIKKL